MHMFCVYYWETVKIEASSFIVVFRHLIFFYQGNLQAQQAISKINYLHNVLHGWIGQLAGGYMDF